VTRREATASGRISVSPAALRAVMAGKVRKGDVLAAARIAGIMAAKRVGDLVPLCHPLALDAVEVALEPGAGGIAARATVRARERTGVEMEALAAVCASLLTVYDMLKATDRGMVIGEVRLESKSGGRSGTFRR